MTEMEIEPLAKRTKLETGSKDNLSNENGIIRKIPIIPHDVDVLNSTESLFSETSRWQKTIQNALKAIVSIRFSQVSAFDTEGALSSEATGFVVDSKLGIILTNRHVVCSGPWFGEAIFHDHEEVDVKPIYRDPVHDFGFLKFDPSKIKFMQIDEIKLSPDKAKVGIDIRVVGNDNGEKLSILSGSLSRLDRNAPVYGDLTYNDFNTFYLQAASSTSGGSSGSPVLNIDGHAVALQAGGSIEAATDFFLPLDRVKRALSYIQQGTFNVPRGTIQTQFLHRPFDEVRRLGLRQETEENVRKANPKDIGMLVVEVVVPKSPSFGLLEEGDVLVSINNKVVTHFVEFESILDKCIEDKCDSPSINVIVERGGEVKELLVPVVDLHSITPKKYVSVGGGILNNVSYQLSRQLCVPREGVYVASPNGMFIFGGSESGWIVTNIDGKPTPNLDVFIEVMKTIPDKKRIPIQYHSILDLHNKCITIVNNERHWSPFVLSERNDETGIWDFTDLGEALPPTNPEPITATFPDYLEDLGPSARLFKSLVKVNVYIPVNQAGYQYSNANGCGVIVDKRLGLVVVSRTFIPNTMVDISITIADLITIYAKPVFLHPGDSYAIIQYDPSLLGDTEVEEITFSNIPIKQGSQVSFVGLKKNARPITIKTCVTDTTTVNIPYSAIPRFRPVNLDAIMIDTPMIKQSLGGVLSDAEGKVQAISLIVIGERRTGHPADVEYNFSFDVHLLNPILKQLRICAEQFPPNVKVTEMEETLCNAVKLRGLSIEVMGIQLAQAKLLGVSNEWLKKVEESNPERRTLYLIQRTDEGTMSSKYLQDNDVILSFENEIVTKIEQFNLSPDWPETVKVLIVRNLEEITIEVPTTEFKAEDYDCLVNFSGAILHKPHRAVLQQSTQLPSQIYISSICKGSPTGMYGMMRAAFITAVNNISVETIDDFISAISGLKSNTYIRIKTVTFDLFPSVVTIKLKLHYWPTYVYNRDHSKDCGWRLTILD